MCSLIAELYPICRSITGDGVRRTLEVLRKTIALDVHEVPSGTAVFDWTVPDEWNIHDAYVKAADGHRVIDFRESNLHVVSYSVPVRRRMTLGELREHLFTRPDAPDVVPYRTSYYNRTWGFCLAQRRLDTLLDGEYEVVIDSTLAPGSLTYGEYYLPGASEEEVLISCHVCHPSLCNDNLSGVALVTLLARELATRPRRYSYRFLFIPGTIGSITWLARNADRVSRIRHGLVIVGVGDRGGFTYKKSRRGDAEIDRVVAHVLKHGGTPYSIVDFTPYGYDERQFCSPGFNLPVGCFMRTPHGQYREYHTSADDLTFVDPLSLADSLAACLRVADVLEGNTRYLNLNPHCEPQLGKRGLYRSIGGESNPATAELAMLWILNLCDGAATLLDIAERSGLPFDTVKRTSEILHGHGLLKEMGRGE